MSQDFDWSNELILRFIEVLSSERALWDFTDSRYKMKHKVNAAWSRVSLKLNVPMEILKNKKKTLMASWRPLFKKKLASIESGVEEDKIFKPVWFAYDAMESFLGSVYDTHGTMNSQEYLHVNEEPTNEPTAPGSPSHSTPSQHSDDSSASLTIKTENQDQIDRGTQAGILSANKRKRSSEYTFDGAEQNANYSYDPLQVSQGGQHGEQQRFERSGAAWRADEEDECDIYAKLLARKLRKYPGRMRDRLMFRIDGLLLDNPYPDDESSSSYLQPSYS